MKLSEMNTAMLADVLVRIAKPIERIGKDEEMNKRMKDIADRLNSTGMMKFRQGAEMFAAVIPALLERHRDDTFAVLSALTGKSEKELMEQPGMQTIREAKACLDEDLMSFFR